MKSAEKKLPTAVIDTNVFVSALRVPGSIPDYILQAWYRNQFILVTSPSLIQELQEVLSREKFQRYLRPRLEDIENLIETLMIAGFVVSGSVEVQIVQQDPKDNKVLACALEGAADFIVTGDKKHLLPLKEYEGIQIVTAREFVEILKY